jgi:hypothetical protein
MAKTVPLKKALKELKQPVTETARVKADGELTSARLHSLCAELSSAIGSAPSVTVDCVDATGPQLGLIQLILSARKTAAAAGKTLSLAKPATGDFLETLRRAGFVSTEGVPPVSEQAFWFSPISALKASSH